MILENFKRVLAQIEAEPETWDQKYWHRVSSCGTAHCFAGWSEIFATGANPADIDGSKRSHVAFTNAVAMKYLGITVAQAVWLFHPRRTLDDFRRVAETGICPEDD